uniref:Uncharacterized protein n=1 Tax=Chelydra serpentina TaxID=8475 RepID=A0A8C3TB47_CHESE
LNSFSWHSTTILGASFTRFMGKLGPRHLSSLLLPLPKLVDQCSPTRLNYSENYAVESSITDECLSYYKDLCKAKLSQLPIIMKAKLFSGRVEKIK